MPKTNIDDNEYDTDALSPEAMAQFVSLQAVDRRIASLQQELAIMQTARNAYGRALQEVLPD